MAEYVIEGGNKIDGKIKNDGSKNAILPILAACIINGSKNILYGAPDLRDVNFILDILKILGCKVERTPEYLMIDTENMSTHEIPESLSREMRSSVIFMGAMISRAKKAVLGFPGGCEIGGRPIDLHIKGLRALGANIIEENGLLICKADDLVGTEIDLDIPSVGATENIMLAAVTAKGTTVIRNAAREPEIVDLEKFLNMMGCKVDGAGCNVITIEGVNKFNSTEYKIMPDRIVAGTYLTMTAISGGKIEIENVIPEHITPILFKLREMGCEIKEGKDKIYLKSPQRLKAIDKLTTMPYPGFPTDMQAPMTALCCVCDGTSIINETIFENRLKHVSELMKMGANITVNGNVAIVKGIKRFHSAIVDAKELRGGAALISSAINAEGTSRVTGVKYIERGYEHIENKLQSLGINIKKI